MQVKNKRWRDEDFFRKREEVLAEWPTGKAAENLDEAVEYNRRELEKNGMKCCVARVKKARREGKTLIAPLLAHTETEDMLACMEFIEKHAPPDIWVVAGDTYTRKGQWSQAQRGLEEALRQGRTATNGWAFVNAGVEEVRRVTESTDLPLWVINEEEGQMLQTEIALAGGIRGYVSADFQDVMEHSKDLSFGKRIELNQYCNRLASYYSERGVPMLTMVAAHVCGWNTPGLKVTAILLAGLESAEQGARNLCIETGLSMSLMQDVAALRAARHLLEEYLPRFGYHDIDLSSATFPWLGSWPVEKDRADAMIAWNAAISVLAGVQVIIPKTADEASAVPTKEAIVSAIKTTRQMLLIMGSQRMPFSEELELEQRMLELEARAVLERVLELGDGDLVVGQIKAVEQGVLDAAFSPWIRLKQKVLPVRDCKGALRYLDHGNIPLPEEVVEYHQQEIAAREKVQKRKADMTMVIDDLIRMSGPLV